ncbi:MAG TPA: hypothetical protein VGS27_09155 [Candidatus Sulfotelmatobacter sp.]|nr:hypothetical protein [Candidatus Sulfotelmatobacter sp.]
MLRLTNLKKLGRKRFCTAIVLLAVCALTISVTTRYTFSSNVLNRTGAVVQNDSPWAPGLQRLLNNAATWVPPFVETAVFHDPGSYSHIAPADTPLLIVLLERNLYNRPPPSVSSLS